MGLQYLNTLRAGAGVEGRPTPGRTQDLDGRGESGWVVGRVGGWGADWPSWPVLWRRWELFVVEGVVGELVCERSEHPAHSSSTYPGIEYTRFRIRGGMALNWKDVGTVLDGLEAVARDHRT